MLGLIQATVRRAVGIRQILFRTHGDAASAAGDDAVTTVAMFDLQRPDRLQQLVETDAPTLQIAVVQQQRELVAAQSHRHIQRSPRKLGQH